MAFVRFSCCLGCVRPCGAEQMATLRDAVVGAEQSREPNRRLFQKKYGVERMEGCGLHRGGPCRCGERPRPSHGRAAAPQTRHRRPPASGRERPSRRSGYREPPRARHPGGLLLVNGANVMMRYLHAPENTRGRLRDGSYVTGDIDTIAADGFIRLTDRWSRFSTIAGEMVPHV